MRRLWIVGAVMVAGLGCGDDSDEGGIGGQIDRIRGELEKQTAIECECFEDEGYDSRKECIDENAIEDGPERCVEEALEDDEGGSDFLDCYLKAERTYTGCIDDVSCDESNEECSSDYEDALGECFDELSDDAAEDFRSCFGED